MRMERYSFGEGTFSNQSIRYGRNIPCQEAFDLRPNSIANLTLVGDRSPVIPQSLDIDSGKTCSWVRTNGEWRFVVLCELDYEVSLDLISPWLDFNNHRKCCAFICEPELHQAMVIHSVLIFWNHV